MLFLLRFHRLLCFVVSVIVKKEAYRIITIFVVPVLGNRIVDFRHVRDFRILKFFSNFGRVKQIGLTKYKVNFFNNDYPLVKNHIQICCEVFVLLHTDRSFYSI